jgi:catalase
MRIRHESFGDHYSQARMFFLSQTETERNHIVTALVFELSKVETPPVRERVVSHLMHVDESLAKRVAAGLGLGSRLSPPQQPCRRAVTSSPRPLSA